MSLMQPYLFPYIGYFQLIKTSDLFVIHDDVQFIKGGWINRNRILINGEPAFLTMELKKDSSTKKITERYFAESNAGTLKKFEAKLQATYACAPGFDFTLNVLREIFDTDSLNVADFVSRSITILCKALEISTPIVRTSQSASFLEKGQNRVLEICNHFKASRYINPIGGLELYHPAAFAAQGIDLRFLKSNALPYAQFGASFVPHLSILDQMMFLPLARIQEQLSSFELVEGAWHVTLDAPSTSGMVSRL